MSETARPSESEPPFSPVIALLTVARLWDGELTVALRDVGLTTRTYGLLGHIHASPGISFSELARRSRITVQSVHTAVAGLMKDGLVEDSTAQAGARSVLGVTDRGSALLRDAAVLLRALDDRLTAGMPGTSQALRAEAMRAVGEKSSFS